MNRTRWFLAFYMLLNCCSPASKGLSDTERALALKKITFDTSVIDENGLIGPPDGQVLIAYKFQIPVDRKKKNEVKKIDKSIRFHRRQGDDTYLCIGEGATENTLIKLASLSYITKIDRFYGE